MTAGGADLLIVGTGALATYFAARCSAAGAHVTMLGGWAEAVSALNRDGAGLEGLGSFPVRAVSDPRACRGAANVLVLVKSWQTERAAGQLAACMPKEGVALTLQNGLGNDEILVRSLGRERVARGVTTLGVTLLRPGMVALRGEGTVCLEENSRTGSLVGLLSAAELSVQGRKDAQSIIWEKLIVSSAVNPLTALLRVKNGRLLEDREVWELSCEVARETWRVAVAQGIKLPERDVEEILSGVLEKTAENTSSMLQDVLRGARTEVDAISGAIVRLGEDHGVMAPLNRLLWSLVKAIPFVVR